MDQKSRTAKKRIEVDAIGGKDQTTITHINKKLHQNVTKTSMARTDWSRSEEIENNHSIIEITLEMIDVKKRMKKLNTAKISNFQIFNSYCGPLIRCVGTNHKRLRRLRALEQKRKMSRQIHRTINTTEPAILQ